MAHAEHVAAVAAAKQEYQDLAAMLAAAHDKAKECLQAMWAAVGTEPTSNDAGNVARFLGMGLASDDSDTPIQEGLSNCATIEIQLDEYLRTWY